MRTIYELGVDVSSDWSFQDGDLKLAFYDKNLHQSIRNRLFCKLGALSLFYTDYGSNVHDWLGEINNEPTQEYLRLEILKTLEQDPRIVDFDCSVSSGGPSVANVFVKIRFEDGYVFEDNFVISTEGIVDE